MSKLWRRKQSWHHFDPENERDIEQLTRNRFLKAIFRMSGSIPIIMKILVLVQRNCENFFGTQSGSTGMHWIWQIAD